MAPPQHLEELSIAGYKSIRSLKDFSLNAGLNVLIGANGSGKTNFIRFFELLGHMMDPNLGLQNYVATKGGADAFLFRGMKVTPELSARLRFGRTEYRFTLRGADDRTMFFADESVQLDGANYNYDAFIDANVRHDFVRDAGSGHRESALRSEQDFKDFGADAIHDLRVYHFHDTSPHADVIGRCNTVDNDVLRGDAGNLAAFLNRIAESHPEHYARIEETVRQVAPFFGTFVRKEVAPGEAQLLWKDRYSDLVLYPHQLSDGTLRYICLAALLLQPNRPSTIIIDEPELGLHPYAIKLLASLLHEAAQDTQLIVSTQSSLLLDQLTPEHVIVVNHRDGESVLERLDSQVLSKWLEEYTLGQLWEKDELGGLP